MFLTIHATSAIVIGQAITNPVGAFLAGLASHYVLDAIPHGDEKKLDGLSLANMSWIATLDQTILLVNFLLLFHYKPHLLLTSAVIAAVSGAMLPDWLTAAHRLSEELDNKFTRVLHRLLDSLQNLHHYLHCRLIPYEIPFSLGLALQLVFLVGLWVII